MTAELIQIERIVDGDTVKVRLVDGQTLTIRLIEIDAPELRQPSGIAAKEALRRLLTGEIPLFQEEITKVNVFLLRGKLDKYRRTLGTLYIDKTSTITQAAVNVNHEMIARGWAMFYDKFGQNEKLTQLQQHARREMLGLFAADTEPIAPWNYRHRQRR